LQVKIRNTVLVFSLLGAGAILPLQGAACIADTAADYVALGSTGCTINGSWTFSNFSFSSTNSGGVAPNNTQETINPLGSGGVGFSFTPTISWIATTGIADVELGYKVAFTGNITSIFQSVSGTISPSNPPSAGFDNINDDYCRAGTLPAGSCAGVQVLNTNLLTTGTATGTASFAATNVVSVMKDVSANATGFPGSTDTVTSFTNCFNGTCSAVPEPGSSGLAGLGLGLGLIALGSVKLRRSA
jgi:hypothetical protein